jgi:RNA polymerase sigma-70 factor, ECF subfamily
MPIQPEEAPHSFTFPILQERAECMKHKMAAGVIRCMAVGSSKVSASADLACVSRALQKDAEAADGLVERLRPVVTRIVRAHVTRRVDEADLAQTVFLRVFASLEQFSGRVPLEHWVSRIAVSVCLNQYRYERNRRELRRSDLPAEQEEMLGFLAASDKELSPYQQAAANDLVAAMLERVAPRERLVMTLLYLEGRTIEEVRQLTGMSALAVRLLAFRARRKMKKVLAKVQQGRTA